MYIIEIVEGIQGEGKYTGYPTTFVRTHGCNCRCTYCDTIYSYTQKRRKLNIEGIVKKVQQLKNRYVCITGGEPLLQKDEVTMLVLELRSLNFEVSIETNGTIEIDYTPYRRTYSYTMDIKCPSSGSAELNNYNNLRVLQFNDEVKFVISDRKDYDFAKKVLYKYPTNAKVIFSPCFNSNGESNGHEIAGWLLEDKLTDVRIGLQIHKVLKIY